MWFLRCVVQTTKSILNFYMSTKLFFNQDFTITFKIKSIQVTSKVRGHEIREARKLSIFEISQSCWLFSNLANQTFLVCVPYLMPFSSSNRLPLICVIQSLILRSHFKLQLKTKSPKVLFLLLVSNSLEAMYPVRTWRAVSHK